MNKAPYLQTKKRLQESEAERGRGLRRVGGRQDDLQVSCALFLSPSPTTEFKDMFRAKGRPRPTDRLGDRRFRRTKRIVTRVMGTKFGSSVTNPERPTEHQRAMIAARAPKCCRRRRRRPADDRALGSYEIGTWALIFFFAPVDGAAGRQPQIIAERRLSL